MGRQKSESVDGIIVDGKELAAWLGLSDMRVSQLVNESVIPRHGKGEYPLKECVQAYCDFARRGSRGSDTAKAEQIERTRLAKVNADLKELAHDELQGALVRADVVRRNQHQAGAILKNNLQSIPDRVSAMLAAESDDAAVHELLTEEIRKSIMDALAAMDGTEVDDASLDITRRTSLYILEKNQAQFLTNETGDEND